jgi:hypothetical protein
MTSVLLHEEFAPISITKELAGRLARFSKLGGFQTTDSYACFLLSSVIEAAESKTSKVVPRWAGGEEDNNANALERDELLRIREELRPLVHITC